MIPLPSSEMIEVSAEFQQVDSLLKYAWANRKGPASQMAMVAENALTLARQANYRQAIANASRYLGVAKQRLGRYNEAIEHLREALQLFQRTDDTPSVMDTEFSLGVTYYEMANYGACLDYLGNAFQAARELGRIRQAARILDRMGRAYCALRLYELADNQFTECLARFEAENDLKGKARALANLGWVKQRVSQHDDAADLLLQASDLTQRLADPNLALEVNLLRSRSLTENGQWQEAGALLDTLFGHLQEREDAAAMAMWQVTRSRVFLGQDNLPMALRHLEQAEELANRLQHIPLRAGVHNLFCEFFQRQGNPEMAFEHYKHYSELHRNQLQAQNVTVQRLVQENLKLQSRQREKELEALRNGEMRQNLELLEIKNREFERKQQAILDYQTHTAELQHIIFPDEADLATIWPGTVMWGTEPGVVQNSFIWAMEAKESNLVAAVNCLGNDAAAGFLTGLLFTVLNEQVTANLNNSLQTFLAHVEQRFFSLLQENAQQRSVEIQFALARIIKGTGTVQIFTRGLPAYTWGQHKLARLESANTQDIHTALLNQGELLLLSTCPPQPGSPQEMRLPSVLTSTLLLPGATPRRTLLEEFFKNIPPEQRASNAHSVGCAIPPVG
jgi:tetratricopeptide (TPR) repeat protein